MDTAQLNGHKRAVIYLRVSSDEQRDNGRGLIRQERVCRQYANDKYKVIDTFSDDCSGTIEMSERPEGSKVFELARSGAIDVVIAEDVTRIIRPKYDEVQYLVLRYALKIMNVELIAIDMPSTGDSFADNIIGLAKGKGAKEEREKYIKRTIAGRIDKARGEGNKPGQWVGTGQAAFGYRNIGKRKEARLEIDEREAELVRTIFDWYVGNDQLNIAQIANRLNDNGIPSPQKGRMWTRVAVKRILDSERYVGIFHYGGIEINLPHLAIIDAATREAAQLQRERNKARAKRHRKHDYELSGHIRCTCGKAMGGATFTKVFRYYMCSEYSLPVTARKCSELRLPIDEPDYQVWKWLYDILKDDQQLDEGLQAMSDRREADIAPKRERLTAIDDLIAKADRRIAKLIANFGDDDDETIAATVKNQINDAKREKNGYISERDRINVSITQMELSREARESIKAKVQKIRGMLDAATFDDKRFLYDALDVQAQLVVNESGRWLYATCGVSADGEVLPVDGQPIELRPTRTAIRRSAYRRR
jgi:site-specific DNA recombinase